MSPPRLSPSSLWLLLPCVVALADALTAYDVPGLYMDGVNPDYLVARALSGVPKRIPAWIVAGNLLFDRFPILGNIYHGTLPFWLGLPFYAVFGTDVLGVRLTNAAFAIMLIAAAWWMLREMRIGPIVSAISLSAMAIDPAFHFIFRTQFYNSAVPLIFLLGAVALIWPRFRNEPLSNTRLLLSGIAAGITAYGYFIHIFYAATLGMAVVLKLRAGAIRWIAGGIIGFLPMIIGQLLFVAAAGADGLARQIDRLNVSSAAPLGERFAFLTSMVSYALSGGGTSMMMMKDGARLAWEEPRLVILVLVPLVALVAGELRRQPSIELRLLWSLLLIPPLAFGLLSGTRLWAHHYAAMVPLAYCTLAVAIGRLPLAAFVRHAGTAAAIGLAAINLVNFGSFVGRLEATGGVGRMSDAINRYAQQATGDVGTYYQIPDWGLFMPFVMITRAGPEVDTRFSPELLRRRLCQGQDVVVVSFGEGAGQRSTDRIAALDWPGEETAIFNERSGKPLIYSTRWRSGAPEAPACP